MSLFIRVSATLILFTLAPFSLAEKSDNEFFIEEKSSEAVEPNPGAVNSSILTLINLEKLRKSIGRNTNHLVVLWSLDCPPCFKELKIIGELAAEANQLPVTLINVDLDIDHAAISEQISRQYNLASIKQYFLEEESAEQIKYQIDSSWYGELPRSYFVNAEGKWQGRSGLLTKRIIELWLLNPQKS